MDTSSSSPLKPDERLRWIRTGILSAFALALSYLETFIPIPIPGVKLGLANLPVLMLLAQHDLLGASYICIVKVLAASLLFGSPVSLAFSAAGTTLAFVCMAALSALPSMRLEMVSVVGALAHETGQLVVAMFILGTPLVWYSAPVLAIAASICGFVLGLIAERVSRLLRDSPYSARSTSNAESSWQATSTSQQPKTDGFCFSAAVEPPHFSSKLIFLVFLIFACVILRSSELPRLAFCLAFAAVALIANHAQLSSIKRALLPTLPLITISALAQILTVHTGTVVFTLGPLALTSDALREIAVMSLRLFALVGASVCVTAVLDTQQLVSVVAWLLSPLRKLGFSFEGPLLALSCALQLAPSLALGFKSDFFEMASSQRESLSPTGFVDSLVAFLANSYLNALALVTRSLKLY